jgi:CO/xanthine dehydrogenase FAD-binding subunit
MDVQAPPGPERRMLARALLQAASTPLRHRITLGGSVADSPAWSDLAAPLLCLQAEVVLLGRDGERRLPYEEYLADRGRRTAHLVREVVVKRGSVSVFALARLAMVRFDYAACHLAMAARLEDGRLADPRIWVTGARGRAVRLTAAEQAVAGSRPDEAAARRAAERAEAAFVSDPRFSAAYKGRWTRIQVRDGLLQMGEEAHG